MTSGYNVLGLREYIGSSLCLCQLLSLGERQQGLMVAGARPRTAGRDAGRSRPPRQWPLKVKRLRKTTLEQQWALVPAPSGRWEACRRTTAVRTQGDRSGICTHKDRYWWKWLRLR
ncbi:hypothetical protein NDU88_004463 [Pleurodeles waltl]|uniref:Uncharacterized protein n=1 Tax=Pleurodeles waltl TaxID=8319 RepID=A0AAV7RLF0_PLEWA|nr:hypothetical protein NDU88_004463 [Pleurodeles waltl]